MEGVSAAATPRLGPLSEALFRRLIFGLLGAGFATLLLIVLATVWLAGRSQQFSALVNHTYQVETQVADLRVMFERTEAGRRGYLISGESFYRDVFDQTWRQIPPAIDELARLTLDNDAQRDRITSLRPQMQILMRQMTLSVERARTGDLEGGRALFLGEANGPQITGIRQLLSEMQNEENRLLVLRNERQISNARLLTAVVIGAGLLLALLALSSLLVMRRYARDLERSHAELRVLNRGLEEAVRERTADLIRANERLESIVARQAALLREVNHRVANSLQLVSSLVQMQTMAVADGAARDALLDTQARIAAIMQVHRRLYTSDDVETVDMREYLKSLVGELEQSLGSGRTHPPVRLTADPVLLKTDKAVSVGVMVTELVTNACKYAYAAGEPGEVRVTLRLEGAKLRLTVEDDGQGMVAGAPAQGTGLGQRVVSAMAKSLASKLEIDPRHKGVRATLAFGL